MKLVDADAMPRQKMLEACGNGKYEYVDIIYGVDVDAAPTIDAVQVVRCKECKHSVYDELIHERWCGCKEVQDDDFCSCGERSE